MLGHAEKYIAPLVSFREGRKIVKKQITEYMLRSKPGGILKLTGPRVNRAVDAAFAAQDAFRETILKKGAEVLRQLAACGEPGIVMVGRPYNVYDAGMNLSVGRKLRDFYGVNCIPLDFLDTDSVDIRHINENMYWDLGRKVIAAARIVGEHPNLHILYITNFKCGPDSFIKHFIRTGSGKPFLSLQFDGHSNDAGMMTRCEAYLDSKGILRPWRREKLPAPAAV